MKGKNVFTKDEDLRLEFLIEQKQGKSKSEQTKIRNRIRSIGFYYSDFSNKKEGYTVEDYRKLKRSGVITIEGGTINIAPKANNVASESKPNSSVNFKKGLAPLVGENPRVLVLGTLPGDVSIQRQAYYSNPNNSFWKILDKLFERKKGQDNESFAKEIGIALWDCCYSAVREGSLDSGFDRDSEKPNDLKQFLEEYPSIKVIVLNGKKAMNYYKKFFNNIRTPQAFSLASTSGTNTIRFEDKVENWSVIKAWLNED